MTQSNASKLANIVAKDLTKPVPGSSQLGIRSESPGSTLSVGGTITADDFVKSDGSQIGGAGGIGTAVADTGPAKDFFYTNRSLDISETVNIDIPTSATSAYIIQEELATVGSGEIIVADGDDLIIDVLGLSTVGSGPLPGSGGRVRADNFTNRANNGPPTFPYGFTASGDVSIGGTLTYQDVTNVDSVGIITANSGIVVSGIVTAKAGSAVTYYGDGSQLSGIDASALKDSGNTTRIEANTSGIVVTGISTFDGNIKGIPGANILGIHSVTADEFFGDASEAIAGRWILGANGSTDYTFTGPGLTGAENDPTLYLTRGRTYQITNGMGMHTFRIQSDPNGATGTQYNDGIDQNDISNATLTWKVQFDAPDTLYYQCTAHPDMGGVIYIGDNSRSLQNIAKSSGYTLIKTDTNKLINMTNGATVTVPSGIFSAGDIITVYNNYSMTMSVQASGTTLRKAGTSNTGTCTVNEYGTASILCVGANEFVVSGNIS